MAAVIAVGYGLYWMFYLRDSVFTDDARVEGRVIPCSSRKMGRLVELPFSEGMEVGKGDVLARFDDADARNKLRQAKAEIVVAEATLERVKASLSKARAEIAADIKSKEARVSMAQAELERILSGAREQEVKIARSKVEAARTRAELRRRELKRVKKLVTEKTVSGHELDRVESVTSEAEENLRSAKLQLHLLETGARKEDRRMAHSNLAVAKAELRKSDSRRKDLDLLLAEEKVVTAKMELAKAKMKKAENDLKETLVRAPMDSVVARVHSAEGQVMQAGQTIVTLVNSSSLWIQANLEEDDISLVKPGDRAKIRIDAYSDRDFRGEVEGILGVTLSKFSLFSATSSSGNYIKVKQRVPVRIRLLENPLPPLYPGLNAEVRIYYSARR
jgi:membrane fusion protein (multidrug efflux system)